MKIYRAYKIIKDSGSYREFYRSPWFVNKELVKNFIEQSGIRPDKGDYQWKVEEKDILETPLDEFDIDDYWAYHEFDNE